MHWHKKNNNKNRFILRDLDCPRRWFWYQRNHGKNFCFLDILPVHCIQFGSPQAIKESVELGAGITLLSQWAIQKELQIGSLVEIEIPDLPIKRTFSFVRHSPFQTKALETFIKLLRNN